MALMDFDPIRREVYYHLVQAILRDQYKAYGSVHLLHLDVSSKPTSFEQTYSAKVRVTPRDGQALDVNVNGFVDALTFLNPHRRHDTHVMVIALAKEIWKAMQQHKQLFPEPDAHDSTYAPI